MAQLGGLAWSLSYGCSWVVAGSGIVWVPAAKDRPARHLSLFLWSQGLSMGASLGFLMEASEQSACSHDSSGLQDQVRQRWKLCYPFYPSLGSCYHHCTLIGCNCHKIPPISSGITQTSPLDGRSSKASVDMF